jgi:lysophospholipase L1-like esterase
MIQDASTFSSPPKLSGATLRQVVHLSIGGDHFRIRLDNTFGEKAMTIDRATAADSPVNFNGAQRVSIPAGAYVWSDPIAKSLAAAADLTVTIHFGDAPSVVTGHSVSVATSFLTSTIQPTTESPVNHWFVLDGVDVSTSREAAAVVAFGDSITDGYPPGANANHRWPDALAARLAEKNVGVVNEGISGNRLTDNGIGPGALARFDRDALAQTAVRWIVLLEGINDIGTDKDPSSGRIIEQIKFADEQIIERAHTHGIKVYGGTLVPFLGAFYASPEKEKNRQALNDWIRTNGIFDAVIDFDAAMRDPQHPDHLDPQFDSGDHLHPSDAGYQHMGKMIDLTLFGK